MRHPRTILVAAALAAIAGCASRASMDAAYEQSLAHWKDAPRADLVASWGRPGIDRATPGGEVLTYVTRYDIDNREAPAGLSAVNVGANGVHMVGTGMSVAPTVPITCTTRFVLQDGRVASWSFEGIGCGAPQ